MKTEKHKKENADGIKHHDTAKCFHNSDREDGENVVRTRYGWVIHKPDRPVI